MYAVMCIVLSVPELRRELFWQRRRTPLHFAAQEGKEAAVRALAECKADVDARSLVRFERLFALQAMNSETWH